MDSRVGVRHPHVGEGEEEHPHDKKSTNVFKKAKAKAMKIKDTLIKHGHDHDHDHDHDYEHIPHDHDLDEEDGEGEETVEDPEVHGAPMYKSAAAISAVHGQPERVSHPGKDGRTTAPHEDPLAPREKPEAFTSQTRVNDPQKSFTRPGQEENYKEQPRVNIGKTAVMEDVPNAPQNTPISFPPEPTAPKPITFPENPQSNPEATNMTKSQDSHEQSNQSSYTEKISSATSSIAGIAISAKNSVASKLWYGEKDNINTEGQHEGGDSTTANNKPASAVDYGKKIATSVTGSDQQGEYGAKVQPDKGMSTKDYFGEKLRPGDEDRALSEVISDTLHKRKEEPASANKRKEEPASGNKPMGKVTESEDVAKGLSTGDENSGEKPDSSFSNNPGKGVMGQLKGAVGSWFGGTKSEESH